MAQSSICTGVVGWIPSADCMVHPGVASIVAMGDSSSHETQPYTSYKTCPHPATPTNRELSLVE